MVGLVECEGSLIGQQQAKVIDPSPGILPSAPPGHFSFALISCGLMILEGVKYWKSY